MFFKMNLSFTSDEAQKINTLAMIAPITNEEKQKLLETKTIEDKSKIHTQIIELKNSQRS